MKVGIITHALFMVLNFLFFLSFSRNYALVREQIIRVGAILAAIGSFFVGFIYIKNLFFVFELDILPLFLVNRHFDAFIPPVSSLFHLFFSAFSRKCSHKRNTRS